MPVLAGQWARQSVNLPLRIRLFTTHKLTKSRFPSRVLCPSDHPSRETIQPFTLPNIALREVEGLQGAALRTRGGAVARLQAVARVCNVGSAWRAAVAGSSRWRRGCRPGWPAALVRSARSHADSHLAAESATAGQSVRRIQAPTGRSARSPGTTTEVLSTAPRGAGTLGAQRHARHHTEGDQVLLTHTNADRARDVTVAVRASVRAWRMSTACMTTCIWLTFSWLTCSWLTCSDMIVLCSTRVITAFLTERLGEGKLLGPDSAWQRSLQQQAWALHAAQVMIMLPVYCSFSNRNKLRSIPLGRVQRSRRSRRRGTSCARKRRR